MDQSILSGESSPLVTSHCWDAMKPFAVVIIMWLVMQLSRPCVMYARRLEPRALFPLSPNVACIGRPSTSVLHVVAPAVVGGKGGVWPRPIRHIQTEHVNTMKQTYAGGKGAVPPAGHQERWETRKSIIFGDTSTPAWASDTRLLSSCQSISNCFRVSKNA